MGLSQALYCHQRGHTWGIGAGKGQILSLFLLPTKYRLFPAASKLCLICADTSKELSEPGLVLGPLRDTPPRHPETGAARPLFAVPGGRDVTPPPGSPAKASSLDGASWSGGMRQIPPGRFQDSGGLGTRPDPAGFGGAGLPLASTASTVCPVAGRQARCGAGRQSVPGGGCRLSQPRSGPGCHTARAIPPESLVSHQPKRFPGLRRQLPPVNPAPLCEGQSAPRDKSQVCKGSG